MQWGYFPLLPWAPSSVISRDWGKRQSKWGVHVLIEQSYYHNVEFPPAFNLYIVIPVGKLYITQWGLYLRRLVQNCSFGLFFLSFPVKKDKQYVAPIPDPHSLSLGMHVQNS